jgi:hypothetical protein
MHPYGSMFKIDKKFIQKAVDFHYNTLVVDQHSDIQMDIVTRRGRGETIPAKIDLICSYLSDDCFQY